MAHDNSIDRLLEEVTEKVQDEKTVRAIRRFAETVRSEKTFIILYGDGNTMSNDIRRVRDLIAGHLLQNRMIRELVNSAIGEFMFIQKLTEEKEEDEDQK